MFTRKHTTHEAEVNLQKTTEIRSVLHHRLLKKQEVHEKFLPQTKSVLAETSPKVNHNLQFLYLEKACKQRKRLFTSTATWRFRHFEKLYWSLQRFFISDHEKNVYFIKSLFHFLIKQDEHDPALCVLLVWGFTLNHIYWIIRLWKGSHFSSFMLASS